MSNSVTIEDSNGETFAEFIDVIGVSEVKKAFQKSIKEGSLRDWFKGSRSKGGKPGWVQVVSGKPCARQPGQKSTPKCVSSAKRASMTDAERKSAQRRKRAADPNQAEKTGAAKPTYVSTDKKKKMSEEMKRDEYGDPIGGPKISKKQLKKNLTSNTPDEKHTTTTSEGYIDLPLLVEIPKSDALFRLGLMFRESLDIDKGMLFIFEEVGHHSFHMKNTRIPLDIAFVKEDGTIESIKELKPYSSLPVYSDGEVLFAIEANRGWFTENNVEVGDEIVLGEAKDKKGKGSGTKDACYHKVKSRYSVWPSAYASGALVKCRKVGAANWGNKSESVKLDELKLSAKDKEGLNKSVKAAVANASRKVGLNRPEAMRFEPKEEVELGEGQKCWKGYEKKGTKMMFGKRYNNCVKKEEFSDWREDLQLERTNSPSTLGDMNSRIFSGDKNTYTTNNITQGGQGAGMALGAIGGAAALHYGTKAAKSIGKSVKNTKDKIKSKFKKEEYSDWRSEIDEGLTAGAIGTAAVLGAVGGTASAIGNMSAKNVAKKLNKEKKEEVGYEGKDDSKKIEEGKSPAWQRKEGKSESGGLNKKGVASYRAANPGSKLKTAVTTKPSKLKKGSKAANRRKSFCSRMKGMKKKLTSAKTARDPDSRINKSLRKWNC